MKRFMVIDGNSLLFRSFYATFRGDATTIMRARNGQATNAIYAFATIMYKIVRTNCPDYALVAFDSKEKTFRHQQFTDYKAGRKETPEDLLAQFPLAEEVLADLGFVTYKQPGYEADDIVGSIAEQAKKAGFSVEIFSGDRDLLQLIDDNVVVKLTKKGLSEVTVMDKAALQAELGLTPAQITDLKGLMGDASDNIPGIPGVGEKTALKLLHEYGTLEKVLEATVPGKLGEKIKAGAESAKMSKELATICRTMDFGKPIDDFKYQGLQLDKLRAFYQKYDLASLLRELPAETLVPEFKIEQVHKIPDAMLNKKTAVVMEMMEDNYHLGTIIGLAVADDSQTVFLGFEDLQKDQAFLNYLADAKYPKIGYDIKRTLVALHRFNIEINNFVFDLPLAAYIMEPNLKENPTSIYHFFGKEIPYSESIYVRHTYEYDKVANYGGLKAHYLYELETTVQDKLTKLGLTKLFYEVELPLALVLAEMEETGIKVDVPFLKQKSDEVAIKLTSLEQQIQTLAGKQFNINSPTQLAAVLFDDLQLPANRKRSTSADILEKLGGSHPIINAILEYRKYSKLQGTYLIGLQGFVLPDGRIHTIYNQMLTQTGRLSSRDPNLQNITARDPELKEVRQAFVASSTGNYLVSLDYSQIELRVLAHMSNAKSLIEAFESGADIHSETASRIFEIPIAQVTPEMRRQAKVVNFGIIYGMSDWGLAAQLGIGVNQAKDFITKYFAQFPEVKDYLNQAINDCLKTGYVRTILGRYRYVREIKDPNYNVREFGKRVAMNTPIQGSAADIIKMAMLKVAQVLKEKKVKTKMILQIHDELIFDVPYTELMTIVPVLEKCMNEAMPLKVKLKVECEYGYNWYHK